MILEMHDICKDYPMGKSVNHILKHIDLEVEEGEYLAIMGPSGSGKTTLMNLIGCLDVPTSGSYLLNGQDITAVENVALPLLYGGVKKAERLERARQALETVGLSDRVDHRPDQLSGGQCQRVAIARAIVGRPKLLLADEPTGALDSASGAQVMDLFQQLHQSGSTIIMITHDQGIAQHAHTIMNIRDGVLSGGAFHE